MTASISTSSPSQVHYETPQRNSHAVVTIISQGGAEDEKNLIQVSQSESASFWATLPQLLDQKLFSDIVFKVQGQEFPANKIVLAAKCPFFYKMFTSFLVKGFIVLTFIKGGMVESHNSAIEITDMTPQTFKSNILEALFIR